jgi:predicted nucleotidyltransferase
MTVNDQSNSITSLEAKLGASWSMIAKARRHAELKRQELSSAFKGRDSEDTSIVVFGSLARNEFTSKSDIDWTLLLDGQSTPQELDHVLAIGKYIEKSENKAPGREGTFGGITLSGELIYNIGGSDDTNRNTTQRILLLLESRALGRDEAYRRVIKNVLRRYVEENYGLRYPSAEPSVPRFLQNDISRYWRTVAVDFAYKQRQRGGSGWALREAKLRLSRKLTYVAGLLMCFSCELEKDEIGSSGNDPQIHPIVEHLSHYADKTPLEIVAQTFLSAPGLNEIARNLFHAYDAFLGVLDDEQKREHLDKLERENAESDQIYNNVRQLGRTFQDSLTKLFLEENETGLFNLTKTYGVF